GAQGRDARTYGLAGGDGTGARQGRSHHRQAASRPHGHGAAQLRGAVHALRQSGASRLSARTYGIGMALTSGLGGQLSIDLGALARNWRALDKVSAGALTAAVVKADAYGSGIAMASRALHAAGARFFFVATPDEGMAVRAAVPD